MSLTGGDHVLAATVMDSVGNVSVREVPITVQAPVASAVLTRSEPTPQIEGATYNFSATCSGGIGTYEYQFEQRGPSTGNQFFIVQSYGPSDTLVWDTSGNIGDNRLRVSCRNTGSPGEVPSVDTVQAGVNPAGAALDATLTRVTPSPQIEGRLYNFTASGKGGSGTYEYRFEVKGPETGNSFQVLRDMHRTHRSHSIRLATLE